MTYVVVVKMSLQEKHQIKTASGKPWFSAIADCAPPKWQFSKPHAPRSPPCNSECWKTVGNAIFDVVDPHSGARQEMPGGYSGTSVTSSDGSSTTASDGEEVRDTAPGLSTKVEPSRLREKTWVWP